SSVASFTRRIRRLQVSLPDDIQIAQIRSSIAFAVVSSGAIFSALNRVSRLNVEPPRPPCGGSDGGDGQSRGLCACAQADGTSGECAAITSDALTRTGNRKFIPVNLFVRGGAASGKTARIRSE